MAGSKEPRKGSGEGSRKDSDGGSRTPSPTRGRTLSRSPRVRHRRTVRGREVAVPVVQRREVALPTVFPTLTWSNYGSWSLLMRAILQTRGLWDAVTTGIADYHDDRTALEAVLRAVPEEMLAVLST